jgi:alanine racemase
VSLHEPLVDGDGVVRPTHVVVDLTRIADNYAALRRRTGRQVIPILKANAYGHGLVGVASALQEAGAPLMGVAYAEEAILLRRAGITADLLVLGGILGSHVPAFLRHGLVLAAASVDKVRAIDEAAAAAGVTARIHLKVDTGMERTGVHWYSASRLFEAAAAARNLTVEGVFSHLSDSARPERNAEQLERFAEALRWYADRGLATPMRHLANSGAVLLSPDCWLDAVRPGLMLYGVSPVAGVALPDGMAPALRWVSRVAYFKVVPEGAVVGYGGTWRAPRQTRLVTVPVGYGDGYLRAMSGRAEVGIRGRRYPVVGTISMDAIVVDIGDDSAWNGDEVLLLGERDGVAIRAEELAAWAGTIPWEVLTAINTRVPRVRG